MKRQANVLVTNIRQVHIYIYTKSSWSKAATATRTAAGTTGNTTAKTATTTSAAETKPESESELDDSSLSSLCSLSTDGQGEKEGAAWEHEPLTDRKKLILERQSHIFDLKAMRSSKSTLH